MQADCPPRLERKKATVLPALPKVRFVAPGEGPQGVAAGTRGAAVCLVRIADGGAVEPA